MFTNVIVQEVGNYRETDWTNPQDNQVKKIKSFALVVSDGSSSFTAEATDDVAEQLRNLNLQKGDALSVFLNFRANKTEKDGIVRWFQRVNMQWVKKL